MIYQQIQIKLGKDGNTSVDLVAWTGRALSENPILYSNWAQLES